MKKPFTENTFRLFLSVLAISGLTSPSLLGLISLTSAASGGLDDIDDHWAYESIREMYKWGMVTGNPDGSFNPNGEMNRAEAAVIISRIVDRQGEAAVDGMPFNDVAVDQWYASAVSYLKLLEIVQGNPDNTYEPSESINRAEFTVLAWRSLEYMVDLGEIEGMIFSEEISDTFTDFEGQWYEGIVSYAEKQGMINGMDCDEGEGTCFYGDRPVTRAEATTILHRAFEDYLEVEWIQDEGEDDDDEPDVVEEEEEEEEEEIVEEQAEDLSKYVDGSYSAATDYNTPGGLADIEVTLTLTEDLVTAVDLVDNTGNSTSGVYIEKFVGGIDELVVGVALDDIQEFSSVNGSSLTPEGFQDAVEAIRESALR